jgi:hypothetical protein
MRQVDNVGVFEHAVNQRPSQRPDPCSN